MPEQEESFVFVDKRGAAGKSEPPQSETGADETKPPEPKDDAAQDDAAREAHPRLAANDRLLMCIDILHQGAWIALGLVNDPVTNQVEKNLDEARVLIDAVSDLATRIEPRVDASIQRDLRTLVSNLRVNYVNQANK